MARNQFLDSETGYYDNETNFSNHDAEMEAKERDREDRFEYEAQAMLADAWEGESEIDRATRRAPMAWEPNRSAADKLKEVA